jgi:hypothetical protein
METKKIELGDVFYVFTNYGICKGHVVRIEKQLMGENGYTYDIDNGDPIPVDDEDKLQNYELIKYKLNIDIDDDEYASLKYGFLYTESQLYGTPCEAIQDAIDTWKCNAKQA